MLTCILDSDDRGLFLRVTCVRGREFLVDVVIDFGVNCFSVKGVWRRSVEIVRKARAVGQGQIFQDQFGNRINASSGKNTAGKCRPILANC